MLIILVTVVVLIVCLVPTSTQASTNQILTQNPVHPMSTHAFNAAAAPSLTLPAPLILAGGAGFGEFAFVHDKGFVAIAENLTLVMYQITGNVPTKIPDIALPTIIDGDAAVLCYGCFMPSLNILDEVYYLVVAMGVSDGTFPNYRFARVLYIYSCPSNSTLWRRSRTLEHPYFTRTPLTLPYVGCFGNRVQGVLDDNDVQNVRQSLYVSATEWEPLSVDRPQPSQGGAVIWFVFFTNTDPPVIIPQLIIQDAKLLTISQLPDTQPPFPAQDEIDYYMRGFGSVFYVQSGQRGANVLAIGNLTNQDTVDWSCAVVENPNAPHGYVQVFTVGTTPDSPGWTQENHLCDVATDTGFNQRIFVNRIVLDPGESTQNGFGGGIFVETNFLLVSLQGALFTFNLSTGGKSPPIGAKSWGHIGLEADGLVSDPTFPGAPFNLNVLNVNSLLGVSTYALDSGVNSIALYNTHSTNLPTVSPTSNLFTHFGPPLVKIGQNESSGSSDISYTGFGQWQATWLSANGRTLFYLVNDPLGNRVLIYSLVAA